VRTQDKNKVADLVKRRHSIRFISTPINIDGGAPSSIPSVPTLPKSYVFGQKSALPQDDSLGDDVAPDQIGSGLIDVDLSDYQQPGFNASDCRLAYTLTSLSFSD